MTDRYSGFVVTLADDVREDDAEAIVTALRMVRGVVSVEPINGTSFEAMVAKERADSEWRERIVQLLRDERVAK